MTKHSDQTLRMTDDRYLRTDHCSVVYAIIWKFIADLVFEERALARKRLLNPFYICIRCICSCSIVYAYIECIE